MAGADREIFDLLQHSSAFARASASRTMDLAHQLAALSDRLKGPLALETIQTVVERLQLVTLRLCQVNLTLACDLDSHADEAVDLISRKLVQLEAQRGDLRPRLSTVSVFNEN